MKTVVLILSNLFLITAAPVDQHHDIEARSASDEEGLQTLITQMRDTLVNVNKPRIADPTPKPAGLQLQEPSPQVQTAYILNPLSAVPLGPPVDPKPAQNPSVPNINLFISGLPQQNRATAAEPPKQSPLQQLVLANPESMPAMQSPAQVVALPAQYSSILPQNAIVMPVSIPSHSHAYPQMISHFQSPAFLGPHTYPYFQPVNPVMAPQRFGPYSFHSQMYPPNPYSNYGMPNVAISPPIIFRERGQTATAPGQF
ncbi:proline-rich protein 36 [Pseudorasbora parva]|uniref:proline-rich protein 36 n=1 Tax=Pseudorasbora parva TaxID=51549 RepID=UPI00351F753E